MSDWSTEIEADEKLSTLIGSQIENKNGYYVKSNDCNNIIVVPKSARPDVIKMLHDDLGHPGMKKTILRVQERYFWPGLTKEVKTFCKNCHLCAINKDNVAPNNAPLLPISTFNLAPFEKVAIDILGPFPESESKEYVVVLQDYFTKWPEIITLEKVDSDAIINWLETEIIPRFGVFNELITDQGVQFVSAKFKNFCKKLGIKRKPSSPFHAQTDGMVEKFNRTFLNMIRNYVSETQSDWSLHIPLVLYAYRTSVNETTGVSPAEALQVRKLRVPIDVMRPPTFAFWRGK